MLPFLVTPDALRHVVLLRRSGAAQELTMREPFFVHILCNAPRGMLYVGVTNHIARRGFEHRSKEVESYTKAHGIDRLAYIEDHPTVETAIVREKRLKRWRRAWKIALIEQTNPPWRDLNEDLNA